jgi:hypothetical protein
MIYGWTKTVKDSKLKERINRVYLNMITSEDEKIYGCGEQFASLNLKNKKVKIWVSEHVPLSSLLKKAVAYTFDKLSKLWLLKSMHLIWFNQLL